MGLQSDFFQGDSRLEACLVNDSAHVTKGMSGDFVGKIQAALLSLDDGQDIDEGEVSNSTYGPSTAAAVLDFKRKRSIINFSYQTKADDIVGKMTIAALDAEMVKKEQGPKGKFCTLGVDQIKGPVVTRRA